MNNRWLPALYILALIPGVAACAAAPAPAPAAPKQTWYVDVVRFNDSAHAGVGCTECHRDIAMTDVPEQHPSNEDLSRDAVTAFDYRACERCHPQEYTAYAAGVHADILEGTRVSESDFNAPKCGNCHSPHYEQANRSRLQLIAFQMDTCGSCHMVERETYLQNFHGKATTLGDQSSPACTDCHGGHQVASLTQTQDALTVCAQCHPTATPNMAGFLIHARESMVEPSERRAGEFSMLFFGKAFLTVLIFGVLGFFYAHTLLWLIRSAHQKMRGG